MNNPTANREQHPSRTGGFTLVELAVTMVIAAILAAIAIPAYSNYVRKAHRTEAKSTLLDLTSLEERFYTTNNNYTQTPTDLGFGSGTATPFTIGSGYYNITTLTFTAAGAPTAALQSGTPGAYTIVATATGDQLKDTSCRTFTVTAGGAQPAQSAADSSGNDTTATCWR
jgi:type IV pilus assembly protein PilE